MTPKINILLIEDDKSICNFIITSLESSDYKVTPAYTGMEGISLSTSLCPNVILLDLGLPDMDGLDVLHRIRSWSSTPVIVISARTKEQDKVTALDSGADDYITKPFVVGILLAKINALLRRVNEYIDEGKLTDDKKDLYLIHESMKLRYKEDIIELTKNEYRILNILLTKEGQIVTREEILEALWDDAVFVDDNTLTVNMTRVKKKLSDLGIKNAIITKRGVGYVFNGLDS